MVDHEPSVDFVNWAHPIRNIQVCLCSTLCLSPHSPISPLPPKKKLTDFLKLPLGSSCVPVFPRIISILMSGCRICMLVFFTDIITIWAVLNPYASPIFVICIPVVVECSLILMSGIYLACDNTGYYDFKLGLWYLQTGDHRGHLQVCFPLSSFTFPGVDGWIDGRVCFTHGTLSKK